ncbi:MAG: hypothetical protein IT371_16800 [Deltaproteobacteria bacterium]|nr:hypothetical protein [Deltaproteobacteria bacterium]
MSGSERCLRGFVRVALLLATSCCLAPRPVSAQLVARLRVAAPNGPRSTIDYLTRRDEDLKVPHAELHLARVIPVPGGYVARIGQRHAGWPVVDGELGVLVLHDQIVAVSGELTSRPAGSPPLHTRARAENAVERAFPTFTRERSTLAIWGALPPTRWVWQVDLAETPGQERLEVLVDAQDGQLLMSRSTRVSARGNAYLLNPVVGPHTEVELAGLVGSTLLLGPFASVSACPVVSPALACVRRATADSQGNFLYLPDEPSVDDAFSEVQAYYQVDSYHRWLARRFDYRRQSTSLPIRVFVNLPPPTGSWLSGGPAYHGDLDRDGRPDLVFAQYNGIDFAYDGEVVCHEYTHNVVAETSKLRSSLDPLGFNEAPAALNEAFADLWPSIYTSNPDHGEYAGGKNGAVRRLVGSTSCEAVVGKESHEASLVWSRALWRIRQRALRAERVDDVIYRTMATLYPLATIAEAGTLLLALAEAEDSGLAAIATQELAARGWPDRCGRFIQLPNETSLRGWAPGRDVIRTLSEVPGSIQWRIDVPKNARVLRIYLRKAASLDPVPSVGFWGRGGGAVIYRTGQSPIADHTVAAGAGSLTIDADAPTKPLLPGASYYVLAYNTSNTTQDYQIFTYVVARSPSDAGGARVDANIVMSDASSVVPRRDSGALPADGRPVSPPLPGEPTGGCACQSSPGRAAGGGLLTLAVLACWRRRKRVNPVNVRSGGAPLRCLPDLGRAPLHALQRHGRPAGPKQPDECSLHGRVRLSCEEGVHCLLREPAVLRRRRQHTEGEHLGYLGEGRGRQTDAHHVVVEAFGEAMRG